MGYYIQKQLLQIIIHEWNITNFINYIPQTTIYLYLSSIIFFSKLVRIYLINTCHVVTYRNLSIKEHCSTGDVRINRSVNKAIDDKFNDC